jgi:hypothetical protein
MVVTPQFSSDFLADFGNRATLGQFEVTRAHAAAPLPFDREAIDAISGPPHPSRRDAARIRYALQVLRQANSQ